MFLGDVCVVEAEARQKLDGRDTKTFQIRNFFDQSQISAWVFNATGRTLGEAPDMHFIDDRIGHGAFQGLIPFPVVVAGVNDNAAHAAVQVVARCAGSSAIPKGQAVSFGVRIDKNLLWIEAMAVPGFTGTIHPVGIAHARFDTFDEGMPDVEASVLSCTKGDDLDRLQVFRSSENQQLNPNSTAAEQRKVHALCFDGASKRMRRTGVTTKCCALWFEWIAPKRCNDRRSANRHGGNRCREKGRR